MQFIDLLIFCATATTFVWNQVQKKEMLSNHEFADTTNETKLEDALIQGKTLNATENVCTVDEHNVPTPSGNFRAEMRLKKLWHRATYIVIRHVDSSEDENHEPSEDNTYILVQRRSTIKDYCPGKLDPTPGGVVGFNEEYDVNSEREMMEEMNIDVNGKGNSMRRLFTFPYEDDKVKCWGGMFEVTYKGLLKDIKMQPEEVSEVMRLSLTEIRKMAETDPSDWMPDGLYALKLYLQRLHDERVKRRLLKGYSSGDLDRYTLRPKPKVIFFDCDDCLYFDEWKVAKQLTAKIEEWCTEKKGLAKGEAYELYKRHGTALRGLLAEGLMENCENAIDEYLRDVHDLPISDHLSKDHKLREMILQIDPTIPKYIFTASVRHHAEKCLKALGIDDLFVDIIDVKTCNLATKHSKEAFEAAMAHVAVDEPECCLFLDDSKKNISAARSVGWRSILVGKIGRDCGKPISSDDAEHEIDRIHDMPKVLPELFDN